MHRPDHSTADPNGISSGVPGYTEGDPLVPTARTIVTDDQMNDMVEGLCRLVEGAGFTLVKNDYDQILNAVLQASRVTHSVGSIVYSRKLYDSSAQSTVGQQALFNDDGTAMYVLKDGADTIYQYTLSTAFDVSTATYASKSLSVASQDNIAQTFCFGDSGTKLYALGQQNDTIYQYTLSTAWDVSTGSYASLSHSVTAQESSPLGMSINADGTKVYVVGAGAAQTVEYTLSTAWDISTASYTDVSASLSSQDATPTGVAISDDGLAMLILGAANDTVYEYELTTANDVSTNVYTGRSFDVSRSGSTITGMGFGLGGRIMLITDSGGNVFQYYSAS